SHDATEELQTAYVELRKSLEKFEAKMEGVKDPKANKFRKSADKCWNEWNDFIRLPTEDVYKDLKTKKKAAIEEFVSIRSQIKELKPEGLKEIHDKLKEDEEGQTDKERPQRIQNLVKDLKKYNIVLSKEQLDEESKVSSGELDPAWG